MSKSAERHWQKWGEQNPFYGVLSDPKFLSANLNEQSREEFFESGEEHVKRVYNVICTKLHNDFKPQRILDFGCGVGRLLIPFARRAQATVGVDVSPGMLEQAAVNCREQGLNEVRLLTPEQLNQLDSSSFDLVHSYIVFQHIPVSKGERLLGQLIALIAQGGIGVIHLTFSDVRSAPRRAILTLRSKSNLIHGLFNLFQLTCPHFPHGDLTT